jgi:hypothetical protein
MALLVAMLPSFLKRKRGAEEEEARGLRAALSAAPRHAVVDKCMELFAANQALALRVREMERARDDGAQAAMRATVRDELARHLAPRWVFCAEGASEPESDTSDEDASAEVVSDGDDSSESSETSSAEDDDDDASSESEDEEEEEPAAQHVRFESPSSSDTFDEL